MARIFRAVMLLVFCLSLNAAQGRLSEENKNALTNLIGTHLGTEQRKTEYDAPATLQEIRIYDSRDSTRIILRPDREIKFRYNLLHGKKSDSVYIDLLHTKRGSVVPPDLTSGSFLRAVRFGRRKDATRVVLDTGKVEKYNVSVMEAPWRIIVDYYGRKKPHPKSNPPKQRCRKKESKSSKRFTVVVDPGHGGKDPGAVSGGVREKDIVLRLARIICEMAKKDDTLTVRLTRSRDRFIPLDKRAIIANRLDGDLFISLHANAFTVRNISGVEVYHLDNRQSGYVSKLAMVENKIKNKRSLINTILVDMTMSFYIDDSMKFARHIGRDLTHSLRPWNVTMRGYKKGALFYVLVGARMPSLLVEIGFLSNPRERRLLEKEEYLRILADSILRGIRHTRKQLRR